MSPCVAYRPARLLPGLACCAVLATVALAAGTAAAQGIGIGKPAAATKTVAVPDPGSLNPNWWAYLATGEPGLTDRVGAVLDRAAEAVTGLPAEINGDASQSLERLRVGLTALPEMLAARPMAREPLPAPAEAYTPRALLQLDRQLRALGAEIDERRLALDFSARAARTGQRELDAQFARYIRATDQSAEKISMGIELMARRAQLEVAEADRRNRTAEKAVMEAELATLREIKSAAVGRIVPDPERTAEQVSALIEKNRARIAEQRELVLRLEAERTGVAASPASTITQLEVADQRILAAVIEEAYLLTRIGLYETELDWLAASGGELDSEAVIGMQERVTSRHAENERIETDAREWLAAASKALTLSLRGADTQLPAPELAARAELTALAQKSISRIDRLRGYVADVRLGTTVTRELLAAQGGWRGWLWLRVLNPAATFFETADETLGATLFRLGDTPVTAYGLLRIVVVLLIAVVMSRFLRHLLQRFGSRNASASAGYYTVGRLLHYAIILAALIIGLSSIGLDFSQLALFAGALSIGIGFGLQSIVNNFVSGLIILFEQNMKVGDVVELDSGVRGVVREISVRSTLISTNDNVDIVVPNADFMAGRVINYTLREPFHRIHVPFGVAYGTDKDLVRRVVTEAAQKAPMTLHMPGREPDVWLVRFGDNSLDFELVVWINPAGVSRPGAVMATYLWEIESTLSANGIQIPFPQRDVRVKIEPGTLVGLGPEATLADQRS